MAAAARHTFLKVHCEAHHLNLVVDKDAWKTNQFCKKVEKALRLAYVIFNKSSKRRKNLFVFESDFRKGQGTASCYGC